KKQKNGNPNDPDDDQCGDYWDFVAYDPEHRLVLVVVPGARSLENAELIVEQTTARLGGENPSLMTSDELAAYATAIETTFGVPASPPEQRGPGRPGVVSEPRLPEGVCYATDTVGEFLLASDGPHPGRDGLPRERKSGARDLPGEFADSIRNGAQAP